MTVSRLLSSDVENFLFIYFKHRKNDDFQDKAKKIAVDCGLIPDQEMLSTTWLKEENSCEFLKSMDKQEVICLNEEAKTFVKEYKTTYLRNYVDGGVGMLCGFATVFLTLLNIKLAKQSTLDMSVIEAVFCIFAGISSSYIPFSASGVCNIKKKIPYINDIRYRRICNKITEIGERVKKLQDNEENKKELERLKIVDTNFKTTKTIHEKQLTVIVNRI